MVDAATRSPVKGKTALESVVATIRAARPGHGDWAAVAARVAAALADHLPPVEIFDPDEQAGRPEGLTTRRLHVEPDGAFSIVALVGRRHQMTEIHDHVTWCVFAVLAGALVEERFTLDAAQRRLIPAGRQVRLPGSVSGEAPPGDIHRLGNQGEQTAVSLHVYGTDVSRIGSSVRRTYDLPIGSDRLPEPPRRPHPRRPATMMNTTSPPMTTGTLEVPGARLHYEVRGHGPLVLLAGAPMDASSFAPLADRLATDHTVLTTDPRGINRSSVDDPRSDSTPELRADDLSRLLAHVDDGPAAVLGSSGGAVSVLALVQAHPEQVHTVVAHEPAMDTMLDDHEQLDEQTADIVATYVAGDVKGAWAKFLEQAHVDLPQPVFDELFGRERDPQEAADQDFWFTHELRATNCWRPDVPALRGAATRIVVGVGEHSGGQLCERISTTLAAALGTDPVRFPGGHIGFTEDPEAFALRLRAALSGL